MHIRRIFFWLHLVAGCVAGAIILLMSFTGVVLTYERQILAWSARGQVRSDPSTDAQRMTVEDLVDAVKLQRGNSGDNTDAHPEI